MGTTKNWTVSLPVSLLREAERTARAENLSKSQLVREALRLYLRERRWRKLQSTTARQAEALGIRTEADIDQLVHAVRK